MTATLSSTRKEKSVWIGRRPKLKKKQTRINTSILICFRAGYRRTKYHIVWTFTSLWKCLKVRVFEYFPDILTARRMRPMRPMWPEWLLYRALCTISNSTYYRRTNEMYLLEARKGEEHGWLLPSFLLILPSCFAVKLAALWALSGFPLGVKWI